VNDLTDLKSAVPSASFAEVNWSWGVEWTNWLSCPYCGSFVQNLHNNYSYIWTEMDVKLPEKDTWPQTSVLYWSKSQSLCII